MKFVHRLLALAVDYRQQPGHPLSSTLAKVLDFRLPDVTVYASLHKSGDRAAHVGRRTINRVGIGSVHRRLGRRAR